MSAPHSDHFQDEDVDDKLSGVQSPTSTSGQVVAEKEVANVAFEQALDRSERLNPLSRTSFTLYFIVMIGFMNAVSSGFDGSLMSGINAMKQYQHFFNMKTTGKSTGIVFMIYTVGNCVGAFAAGPVCDRFGRRGGMFTGGFFILVGSAIIVSSQNVSQFMGGRFLLGFGIAISTTAAPTWVTELAPPQWRGRLGASYNSCFFIGSIPATGSMVGTIKMHNNWSWRLPLLLQIIPPIIVMSGIWFTPESPRWLVQHGRKEEARAIMRKYHTNDGKDNALIDFQIHEFEQQIEMQKRTNIFDYSVLFRTANARWRLFCVWLMCWNGQLAGNGLVTYYLPEMFATAGIQSSDRQIVLNFANSITSATGAFTGAFVTDRINRRPRLFIGAFVLACMLTLVAVLSKEYGKKGNTNVTGANASIVFIFLFGVAYAFTYTPLQALYCAEVLNQEQRARGMGVHILISNIAGFINTFGNSVGLQALGYKYYFVFVGWNCCASVLWYLFGVETRGRTLEELDDVFNSSWPARASTRKTAVVVKESGAVEVVKEEV